MRDDDCSSEVSCGGFYSSGPFDSDWSICRRHMNERYPILLRHKKHGTTQIFYNGIDPSEFEIVGWSSKPFYPMTTLYKGEVRE